MRRTLMLTLAAGSVASGAGCFKHIAGKCDCTYDPADNVLPGPGNPYFPGATFTGPVAAVPETAGASKDGPTALPAPN